VCLHLSQFAPLKHPSCECLQFKDAKQMNIKVSDKTVLGGKPLMSFLNIV
jgi:hypothetical protein